MTRSQIAIAVSFSLLVGACCCGGGGHANTAGGAQTIKAQPKVMADPGRIKAVHKVALISVTAPCDVDDRSMEGNAQRSGGSTDVFSAMHAAKTMKHLDATRAPASLDLAIPAFQQQLAATTGWSFLPEDEVISNPTYRTLTLDTELHAQVRATRKVPWCTGDHLRVLTADYTQRAGEIAAALHVDAVVLANVHLYIDNWRWNDTGDKTKGYWVVAAEGNSTVVGPDGQILWQDTFQDVHHQKFIGFDDEKHGGVHVVTTVDWEKVPHNAVKTMVLVAQKIGTDLKASVASTPAPAPAK